jgi:hypothetical protein
MFVLSVCFTLVCEDEFTHISIRLHASWSLYIDIHIFVVLVCSEELLPFITLSFSFVCKNLCNLCYIFVFLVFPYFDDILSYILIT